VGSGGEVSEKRVEKEILDLASVGGILRFICKKLLGSAPLKLKVDTTLHVRYDQDRLGCADLIGGAQG
jgi:hypothetical protein